MCYKYILNVCLSPLFLDGNESTVMCKLVKFKSYVCLTFGDTF